MKTQTIDVSNLQNEETTLRNYGLNLIDQIGYLDSQEFQEYLLARCLLSHRSVKNVQIIVESGISGILVYVELKVCYNWLERFFPIKEKVKNRIEIVLNSCYQFKVINVTFDKKILELALKNLEKLKKQRGIFL